MSKVAPARERGLKFRWSFSGYSGQYVAPARERGLKSAHQDEQTQANSRSREGAWIEIPDARLQRPEYLGVAPARERGLKSKYKNGTNELLGRSREGAWIEMLSRWILGTLLKVAPARERGLKC